MFVTSQFSIFMVNKPGILAHILVEFAKGKINITAMTVMDSVEHGVLRVVFDNPELAEKVLTATNLPFNKTDVLCVNLDNRAGALAGVAEKLASSHINISYAYCTSGLKGGRTIGILKVADVKKAMKVLQEGKKATKSQPVIRRHQATSRI